MPASGTSCAVGGGAVKSQEGVGIFTLPEGGRCQEGISQNFNYYDHPVVETAQSEFFEEKFLPLNGLDSDPYEFSIETVGDTFLHLGSIYLYCRAKIVKADGSNMAPDASVAPVNNGLASLWRMIEVKLNNVTLNPASSYNVHLKSMLENLLTYEEVKRNNLQAALWAMDDAGKVQDMTNTNSGYQARKGAVALSKTFDMCGRVPCDFLQSDNHLAPGNKLSLRFTRTSDAFYINTSEDEQYKLKIVDLALYARRIRLTPEAFSKVYKPKAIQRYISTYTELKEYPQPAGAQSLSVQLYAGGRLPKKIVVAQVQTAFLVGHYKRNPFEFEHFDLNRINLKLNGTRIPQDPLEPNFGQGLVHRAFNSLYMNTGKYRSQNGNCIDGEAFKGGYAIFAFDLTPDLCNRYHLHSGYDGTLELEMGWENQLPHGVTVLVYAASDQVVFLGGPDSSESSPQVVVF